MKRAAVSILLTLVMGMLNAQVIKLDWAKKIGGGNNDFGNSIAVDVSGNVISAGYFRNTVNFDPGVSNTSLTAAGFDDIYVLKQDNAGAFIWVAQLGGISTEFQPHITVDPSGNVLVTGAFSGTTDFDPGPGSFPLTAVGASLDIFVCMLDANGGFMWAKRMGGNGNDYGHAIAVAQDGSGTVYVTGQYEATANFDPGVTNTSLVAAGGFEIFVSKLDQSGNFLWAKSMGGPSNDSANGIGVDFSGSVYTTGYFMATADFDPGAASFPFTSAGNEDIFISKLDASGNFVFAKQIGGTGTDMGEGIVLDVPGNIYSTGFFASTVDFDPGPSFNVLTSFGGSDIYVSKSDASGNLTWVKQMGGSNFENPIAITVDPFGNVYTTGGFYGPADFDPGLATFNLAPKGDVDIFISKLDHLGNFVWAQEMGGGVGNTDFGFGIATDDSQNVYTTGYFVGTADFDPGSCAFDITSTGFDAFVQKLTPSAPLICTPKITSFSPTSGVYGTTVTINGANFDPTLAGNVVFFGAIKATVTAAISTQLTVTVPAGATFQPITVTANGLTAFSVKSFVVTFPDGGIIDACSFAPKVGFVTGDNGGDPVLSDVDGDGWADVVAVNANVNTVSVLQNNKITGVISPNSLLSNINFGTGTSPAGVTYGDVDGDGKADMIVTNQAVNTVSVFKNTSASGVIDHNSFANKVDFTTGSGPLGVAIGDFNGDGKPDLAVANTVSNTVSIFKNTGTPGLINATTFDPKLDINVGTNPSFVAIGDVDKDQSPELIVTNKGSNTVSIFKNFSSINNIVLASNIDISTDAGPYGVALGDLDNDGDLDLAISNINANTITILNNNSDPGEFSFGNGTITAGNRPNAVAIGDLDGDGKPDLAVSNFVDNTVSVFRNTSLIFFITFSAKVDFTSGTGPVSVAIGDIDEDGKADLVLGNSIDNVSILRNTVSSLPPPTLDSFTPIIGSVGTSVTISGTNFSTTPLNNTVQFNGTVATVTASTGTDITTTVPTGATTGPITVTVGCYTVTSGINFTVGTPAIPTITSFAPLSGPVGTSVTINGTGFSGTPSGNIVYFGATRANVTSASSTSLSVTVPVGASYQPITVTVTGLSAFSSRPFLVTFANGGVIDNCSMSPHVDIPVGTNPQGVVIADLDGDGKSDIVVANGESNSISVLRNISTIGSLTASSFASTVDFNTGANPRAIAVNDVDGDGKPDLVVTNYDNNSVSVFRNTSTPGAITASSFAANVDFLTDANPNSVALNDLNNDGKPDMVVANYGEGDLSVYMNTGSPGSITSGTFAPSVTFNTGSNPVSIVIGEADGDGKPDLVVGDNNGSKVSVFLNTTVVGSITSGSFAPKVDFNTGYGATSVALGDIDGDGRLDIVASSTFEGSNDLSVLRNTGSPGLISFSAPVDFQTGETPNDVGITDVDGDGNLDIAVTNYDDTGFSLFKNTSSSGSITTGSLATKVDFTTGNRPDYLALGDLDGDGKPDVVVTNFDDESISIFRNTISSLPPPTITSFTPGSGPVGSTVTITGTNFSTTPSNNTVEFFNGISATVTASSSTSITTTVPVGATSGVISVTVGCNTATSASSFTVTVLTITTQPSDAIACNGTTATFTTAATGTTNIVYQWQFATTGAGPFNDISNGGGYSAVTTPVLSVNTTGNFGAGRYRCKISGDFGVTVFTFDEGLFINPTPSAPTVTNASNCGPTSFTLSAAGGTNGQYRWYTVASGGTAIAGEVNNSYVTPVLSATTIYFVSINNGTCESARTSVTATISVVPSAPVTTGGSACGSGSITLTASGGSNGQYRWYTVAAGGAAIAGEVNSNYITPVLSTSITYFVSINNGTCEGARTSVVAQINSFTSGPCNHPPVITSTTLNTVIQGTATLNLVNIISDPDNNLDLSTLKIIQQPTSGALATIDASYNLKLDYTGKSFAGKDELTIGVCDSNPNCTQQILTVDVKGDLVVNNGISPDGNGQNDTWVIQNIGILDDTKSNHVSVFDRWGDAVFETDNYNNDDRVFTGKNKNGNELPGGTYFYKIDFASGRKSLTGYLSLKR